MMREMTACVPHDLHEEPLHSTRNFERTMEFTKCVSSNMVAVTTSPNALCASVLVPVHDTRNAPVVMVPNKFVSPNLALASLLRNAMHDIYQEPSNSSEILKLPNSVEFPNIPTSNSTAGSHLHNMPREFNQESLTSLGFTKNRKISKELPEHNASNFAVIPPLSNIRHNLHQEPLDSVELSESMLATVESAQCSSPTLSRFPPQNTACQLQQCQLDSVNFDRHTDKTKEFIASALFDLTSGTTVPHRSSEQDQDTLEFAGRTGKIIGLSQGVSSSISIGPDLDQVLQKLVERTKDSNSFHCEEKSRYASKRTCQEAKHAVCIAVSVNHSVMPPKHDKQHDQTGTNGKEQKQDMGTSVHGIVSKVVVKPTDATEENIHAQSNSGNFIANGTNFSLNKDVIAQGFSPSMKQSNANILVEKQVPELHGKGSTVPSALGHHVTVGSSQDSDAAFSPLFFYGSGRRGLGRTNKVEENIIMISKDGVKDMQNTELDAAHKLSPPSDCQPTGERSANTQKFGSFSKKKVVSGVQPAVNLGLKRCMLKDRMNARKLLNQAASKVSRVRKGDEHSLQMEKPQEKVTPLSRQEIQGFNYPRERDRSMEKSPRDLESCNVQLHENCSNRPISEAVSSGISRNSMVGNCNKLPSKISRSYSYNPDSLLKGPGDKQPVFLNEVALRRNDKWLAKPCFESHDDINLASAGSVQTTLAKDCNPMKQLLTKETDLAQTRSISPHVKSFSRLPGVSPLKCNLFSSFSLDPTGNDNPDCALKGNEYMTSNRSTPDGSSDTPKISGLVLPTGEVEEKTVLQISSPVVQGSRPKPNYTSNFLTGTSTQSQPDISQVDQCHTSPGHAEDGKKPANISEEAVSTRQKAEGITLSQSSSSEHLQSGKHVKGSNKGDSQLPSIERMAKQDESDLALITMLTKTYAEVMGAKKPQANPLNKLYEPLLKGNRDLEQEWYAIALYENEAKFGFLWKSVILTVTLESTTGSEQFDQGKNITNLNLHSKVTETSHPVAKLAHKIVLQAWDPKKLMELYPKTTSLLELLQHLSREVYRARVLVLDIQCIAILHAFQLNEDADLSVEIWGQGEPVKYRMIIPVNINIYPYGTIEPKFCLIKGEFSTAKLEKAVAHVKPGRRYFTRMVQAVDKALLESD